LSVANLTASGGTLVDNGNGTWTFTPAANFNGTVTLSYNVSDGVTTTPASGAIAVSPVNVANVVSGPTGFPPAEDSPVVISAAQLLANASDVDGDALSVTNLTA